MVQIVPEWNVKVVGPTGVLFEFVMAEQFYGNVLRAVASMKPPGDGIPNVTSVLVTRKESPALTASTVTGYQR